jgi:hypothetical protein
MLDQLLKRSAPLATIALGIALSGCGEMDVTINGKEGVPLAELDMGGAAPDEIVVASGDRVIITEGTRLQVSVDGDADAVNGLRFIRDGNMLGVTRQNGSRGDSRSAIVRVTMAAPRELTIGGSGEIEAPTVASSAQAIIGGSGTIRLGTIAADRLEVTIGGAGEISGNGTARSLEISIGGSGDANFSELVADDVEISIGGSGNVKLRSDGEVNATIGGSGSISVLGNAKCTLNSFGSGTLDCEPKPSDAAREAIGAE